MYLCSQIERGMGNLFEGYVGIRLRDGQSVNDMIFCLVFVLFIGFALAFHTHRHFFRKMTRDLIQVKERESIFEEPHGSEAFFRNFMIIQTLFLCSLCLFSIARAQGYLGHLREDSVWIIIGLILLLLSLFYWGKRCFYYLFALIFTNADRYRVWRTGYNAIVGMWGVSLYIPVLWLIFVDTYAQFPIFLFIISYVLCRFVIIYKTLRIFYTGRSGILYINLYLCGQEILPLFFLYEGSIYLYNFIESSALWH